MKTKNLYIIDNDEIFVYGLKMIVAKHQLSQHVTAFTNGEEAIESIRKNQADNDAALPDIILLDLNMPVLDGWEFMEEYIRLKPLLKQEVQIYMLSSSINPADIERAKSYADITSYLTKPLQIERLIGIFN